MNASELLARLRDEGFNPISYRIEPVDGGRGRDDCYRLRREGARWIVEYLERGSSRTLAAFDSEAAACAELFGRLAREPIARSHLLASFTERERADELVARLRRSGISPTHRDAPVLSQAGDVRYRVFVDGRDLTRAKRIRDGSPGGAT